MASAPKAIDEWEESLFVLAEKLHLPVYKIKAEMPLVELIGWHRYFARGVVKEPEIDLSALSPEDLGRMFG